MLTRHRDKWRRYKLRHDKTARKELICEFLPLVHYVFSKMSVYLPRVLDDQDLIAAGVIGLISAVGDFDIKRGIEFTTFAVPRIRGAILDELREHDWVPRTARRRAAELRDAVERSREDEFSAPDLGKVARLLGIRRADLSRLMYRVNPASFVPLEHGPNCESDDTMDVRQLIADAGSHDPSAEVELTDQCSALASALDALPDVERRVISQYYFEQRMQKDIAKELRVSRSRVSQIHNQAVTTLRERLEAVGAA